MRDVHIALQNIDHRTHNEFAQKAHLHGIKLPLRNKSRPNRVNTEFDKKEQEKIDAALRQAMIRNANMKKGSK